jgi:cyclopropane-fatty-acyl-phospholipid synthase
MAESMAERARTSRDEGAVSALRFLQELLATYHPRNFAIELWDGTTWGPEKGQFRRFTWQINNPQGLRTLIRATREIALGEAYIYQDFDIDGDVQAVFPMAEYLMGKSWTIREKLRLARLLAGVASGPSRPRIVRPQFGGRLHSPRRDREAAGYHYDVSNDFYALWLDKNLTYSCAYFQTPDDDLDKAQEQKLDYICRKLRLRPGERLLDIGCGWGGLITYAASKYGVQACGITLSRRQLEFAQRRIQQQGLCAQCDVRLIDYRDLEDAGGYDKLASVGMVEHVGESKLHEYFARAFQLLRAGGVFLNHGIGRAGNRTPPEQPTFTDVYVFPDGELVPLATTLKAAEGIGFEVRDVENLREHYALTLCHWLRRLEANANKARELVGEVKYRIWHLYLAGSAHYFRTAKLDLYQTLLVKADNGNSGLPLTRADWY